MQNHQQAGSEFSLLLPLLLFGQDNEGDRKDSNAEGRVNWIQENNNGTTEWEENWIKESIKTKEFEENRTQQLGL